MDSLLDKVRKKVQETYLLPQKAKNQKLKALLAQHAGEFKEIQEDNTDAKERMLNMLQFEGPETYFPNSSTPSLDDYYAKQAATNLNVPYGYEHEIGLPIAGDTRHRANGVSYPDGNRLYVSPNIQYGAFNSSDQNQMNTLLHEGSHIANFDRGSDLSTPNSEEGLTRMLDYLRSPNEYNTDYLQYHGVDPSIPFDSPDYRELLSSEYQKIK